jgi:D-glycero-beta-D-manno-heptose-7-phosphate kinase
LHSHSKVLKKYNSIPQIFEDFNQLNVLIVGDVMLDAYLWGKVDRISPEAPVPIVAVSRKENRLGGAANVAINIKALGAHPFLCSVIGNDRDGDELIKLMKDLTMSPEGIVKSPQRVTTVKTRVIGNNHQLLRVDDEMMQQLKQEEEDQLFNKIKALIEKVSIHVIIFEDYDKGVLGESLISRIVALAREKKIPTAVDPKKKNFNSYKNVSLFKPNLHELRTGLKIDIEKPQADELEKAVASFKNAQQIDTLMVTLSEAGVFYCNNGKSEIIPAHIRNISDVSGAGDTVISVAALCLALGLSPSLMSTLANLAGGLVCEKVGVVPVDKGQLLQEASSIAL